MTTTDTSVNDLIINQLTQEQYEAIDTPSDTELYFVTDGAISSSDVTTALGYTPQQELVSGTSIKTINNTSLLGSGNITITDTKDTTGSSNSSSKLYIVGALNQSSAATTYSKSTVYMNTNGTLNCVTPASTKNDTTVATTKWVKDLGYTTNTGTVTSVNNVSPVNGNVTLSIPTVDQTYNSSSSNAQSGVAIAGAGFLTSTDISNMLTTDTTQDITASKNFKNTFSKYSLGTQEYGFISANSGYDFQVSANGNKKLTLGGTDLYFYRYGYNNYQLLDGTTGLIPDARISSNIARIKDIRNIGEIVTSTIPLTDAGLHLLDGSLLQYASYKDFIDYIASICNASLSYFCTEADWQTAVTNYGVCGKFVYNSTNNTVRLPKITGFIEGASGTTNLGDVTGAGLPNITGSAYSGGQGIYTVCDGAFTLDSTLTKYINAGSTASRSSQMNFDASNCSSIYGNSNTVQPQSTKVLYYIVIANTTKTAIEVDIDEIATDLNGKADTDLSNVANTSGLRRLVKSGILGTAWYKIYSEYNATTGNYIGLWAECGDLYYKGSNAQGDYTISFPFVADDYQFTNTNYTVIPSVSHSDTNLASYGCYEKYASRTKYSTVLRVAGQYFGYAWTACGYVEITS